MDEAQVRMFVAKYLAGEVSLRELDQQIAPVAWDSNVPDKVRSLVNEIESRIDEYSSAACDLTALSDALVPFVTRYETAMIIGAQPAVVVRSAASSESRHSAPSLTPTSAGKGFAAASSLATSR